MALLKRIPYKCRKWRGLVSRAWVFKSFVPLLGVKDKDYKDIIRQPYGKIKAISATYERVRENE